jgi:hypothetical protein
MPVKKRRAICHKTDFSNYYTLPTGHIVRLANHPSFDLAGQSADIYIQPTVDSSGCPVCKFVLRAFLKYDSEKHKNICYKRTVNSENLLKILAEVCEIRSPRAYDPHVGK